MIFRIIARLFSASVLLLFSIGIFLLLLKTMPQSNTESHYQAQKSSALNLLQSQDLPESNTKNNIKPNVIAFGDKGSLAINKVTEKLAVVAKTSKKNRRTKIVSEAIKQMLENDLLNK